MATVKERLAKLDAEIALQKEVRANLLKKDQREDRIKKFADLKAARATDTRRKILLGALSMQMMNVDPVLRVSVNRQLDAFLEKDYDRKLFDFPIRPPVKPLTTIDEFDSV